MAQSPPEGWSLERRREYFDWAKAVIDNVPEKHGRLAALFEEAYAAKP